MENFQGRWPHEEENFEGRAATRKEQIAMDDGRYIILYSFGVGIGEPEIEEDS